MLVLTLLERETSCLKIQWDAYTIRHHSRVLHPLQRLSVKPVKLLYPVKSLPLYLHNQIDLDPSFDFARKKNFFSKKYIDFGHADISRHHGRVLHPSQYLFGTLVFCNWQKVSEEGLK